MKIKFWFVCMCLTAWVLLWSTASQVFADATVVHAVLYYSPTCPHCHKVITEDLPPLFDKYGDQLQIVGVDTSSPGGRDLFQSAIERFDIPPERQAVPMLVIDDIILLGALEIPDMLPGLVDAYLAQGGVGWPDIPSLAEALAAAQAQQAPNMERSTHEPVPTHENELAPSEALPGLAVSTETNIPSPTPPPSSPNLILANHPSASLLERLARDPAGNTLAILVLIGMIISVGGTLALFLSQTNTVKLVAPPLTIPILCLMGVGIAGYLAYVETAQITAVCGPVGDCNTVQQSEYARLLGVLPIGVLGIVGYLAILITWLVYRFGSGWNASLASLAALGLTFFGTLFSIYLTFIEPFVIGATCAWCLTSAVIMTILMWLSIIPSRHALRYLRYGEAHAFTENDIKRPI